MDFTKVKAGMLITYTGESFAFGKSYLVMNAESTYEDINDCPEYEKGKLMIAEFMNDGTPMFFTLEMLNADDWKLGELS